VLWQELGCLPPQFAAAEIRLTANRIRFAAYSLPLQPERLLLERYSFADLQFCGFQAFA